VCELKEKYPASPLYIASKNLILTAILLYIKVNWVDPDSRQAGTAASVTRKSLSEERCELSDKIISLCYPVIYMNELKKKVNFFF
jgi:hypothetical protein